MGVQPDVMIFVFVLVEDLAEEPGCAKGPDRVPNADEPNWRTGTRGPYVVKGLDPFRRSRALTALVAIIEFRNIVVIVFLNEADFVHEARESADRECPAAEAEEVEFVTGLVVVDHEAIKLANVGFNAFAECTARKSVKTASRADAVMIIHCLIDPLGSAGMYCARDLGNV